MKRLILVICFLVAAPVSAAEYIKLPTPDGVKICKVLGRSYGKGETVDKAKADLEKHIKRLGGNLTEGTTISGYHTTGEGSYRIVLGQALDCVDAK